MSRRITGFSSKARSYVEHNPGKTAQEIVRHLRQAGEVQSAAREPEGSLVATLHKHHVQLGLERRWDNGVYRYYPPNGHAPSPSVLTVALPGGQPQTDNEVVIAVRLPQSTADIADTLVASGTCKDRSEAVSWLVNKGISAIRLTR